MAVLYGQGVSKGRRPTKSMFPKRDYRTVKQEAMDRMEGDIKELIRGLTSVTDPMSFYRLVTENVSRALITFCYFILDEAVARTPYRTGELRSSGKVTIRTGAKQLTGMVFPAIDVRADRSRDWHLRTHTHAIKRPSAFITAEISFERIDEGKDIALWAHEELLGYEERPKTGAERRADTIRSEHGAKLYAVKPGGYGVGTGPKYLEGPYMEKVGRLSTVLQRAVDKSIWQYNRKTGQRVRRR